MGNIEAVKVSQKIRKTSKQYWAIAAVKTQTLAVGCQGGRIDLINHSGTILCMLILHLTRIAWWRQETSV
ncbi:hypothetical protein RRG08_047464 [Elysia crispata]|uniref:Uncharacterized protein n=1 Tax=Elysia crispata TaxID=231223 RepID=A0AAE1D4Q0_9GAST|nr:hypothetical protein RRG08_047464 [Elysia crispata]